MKKRIVSLAVIIAFILCAVPFASFTEVNAKAMSNADALTPFAYLTGEYTVLRKLTLYTTSAASTSAGKTLPIGTKVSVTAVSGEFGKVTYDGKTGWINLSYALNPQNKADVAARLNMLRKKFPAGMYWNRPSSDVNNPDGYTDQPCPSGHTDHRDNTFDGTGQCHGFAIKLGYDLFGMHANCWDRHYDIDKIVVGDLVRYRGRHTVMITGVYSTYFTVADCNWDYSCNIEWDRKMNKSYISFNEDNASDGVYHCPINGGSTSATSTTTTKATTTTTTTKATTTTIKATTTTKATTAATTQKTSGSLQVTATALNVRASASTTAAIVTKVKQGAKYNYTNVKTVNGEKWYYITVSSSLKGWVMGKYVKLITATTTTQVTSGSLQITATALNVRASASRTADIVTTVKNAATYNYTNVKTVNGETWYYITVSSTKKGWVLGDYVKLITTTAATPKTSGSLQITATALNVRASASRTADIVTRVKQSAKYNYTNVKTVNGETWYYITVSSSLKGWVIGDYVKVISGS